MELNPTEIRFPSDCDHRGRHSANHTLLPDMHLHVPVLHVTTCHNVRLVQDVRRYLVNCKVM